MPTTSTIADPTEDMNTAPISPRLGKAAAQGDSTIDLDEDGGEVREEWERRAAEGSSLVDKERFVPNWLEDRKAAN